MCAARYFLVRINIQQQQQQQHPPSLLPPSAFLTRMRAEHRRGRGFHRLRSEPRSKKGHGVFPLPNEPRASIARVPQPMRSQKRRGISRVVSSHCGDWLGRWSWFERSAVLFGGSSWWWWWPSSQGRGPEDFGTWVRVPPWRVGVRCDRTRREGTRTGSGPPAELSFSAGGPNKDPRGPFFFGCVCLCVAPVC